MINTRFLSVYRQSGAYAPIVATWQGSYLDEEINKYIDFQIQFEFSNFENCTSRMLSNLSKSLNSILNGSSNPFAGFSFHTFEKQKGKVEIIARLGDIKSSSVYMSTSDIDSIVQLVSLLKQ